MAKLGSMMAESGYKIAEYKIDKLGSRADKLGSTDELGSKMAGLR